MEARGRLAMPATLLWGLWRGGGPTFVLVGVEWRGVIRSSVREGLLLHCPGRQGNRGRQEAVVRTHSGLLPREGGSLHQPVTAGNSYAEAVASYIGLLGFVAGAPRSSEARICDRFSESDW